MNEDTLYGLMTIAVDGGVSASFGRDPSAPSTTASLSGNSERDIPRITGLLRDGAWVLDCRPCSGKPGLIGFAIRSPMPDDALADGDVTRAPTIPAHMLDAGGLGGAYLAVAAVQVATRASDRDAPGPLDKVPLGDYCRRWQAFGARIGRVTGGAIVWDDGRRA